MNAKLRDEEHDEEEKVHSCEPEQRTFLGEGEYEDEAVIVERPIKSLLNCVESSEQQKRLMIENEARESRQKQRW